MGIKHLLEALLNPFFILFVMILVSFLLVWRKKNLFAAGVLLGVTLLSFLILSTGFFPKWVTHYLEEQYPVIVEPNKKINWIVILGGGQARQKQVLANNLLYSASLKRFIEGVRLYRAIPNAKLVLSGGDYGAFETEAQSFARLAALFAIPVNDLVLEKESINTMGQAKEVKNIVNQDSFYLVTSAMHMPRAMHLFREQGLHPIAAPTDFTYYWDDERWPKLFIPNAHNMVYFSIAWHEILGSIWAKIIS